MAQPTAVPQHVTALLSHLTSRPGVQSTLILSRRDGSIIQGTGLLTADLASRSLNNAAASRSPLEEPSSTSTPTSETSPSTPTSATSATQPPPPETQEPGQQRPKQQQQAPYQPTHAAALAAHIFAFVSSASDLSMSLSHPPEDGSKSSNNAGLNGGGSAEELGNGGVSSPREEGEHEGHEREEDDEVKLLRLRTKKHEIVVVPDRKYLLCVVHDAAHSTGAGSGNARSR